MTENRFTQGLHVYLAVLGEEGFALGKHPQVWGCALLGSI